MVWGRMNRRKSTSESETKLVTNYSESKKWPRKVSLDLETRRSDLQCRHSTKVSAWILLKTTNEASRNHFLSSICSRNRITNSLTAITVNLRWWSQISTTRGSARKTRCQPETRFKSRLPQTRWVLGSQSSMQFLATTSVTSQSSHLLRPSSRLRKFLTISRRQWCFRLKKLEA
jgi:hypothetical protein